MNEINQNQEISWQKPKIYGLLWVALIFILVVTPLGSWLFGVYGGLFVEIVVLVLLIIALKKIKRNPTVLKGKAFAWVLLGVDIIFIFFSLASVVAVNYLIWASKSYLPENLEEVQFTTYTSTSQDFRIDYPQKWHIYSEGGLNIIASFRQSPNSSLGVFYEAFGAGVHKGGCRMHLAKKELTSGESFNDYLSKRFGEKIKQGELVQEIKIFNNKNYYFYKDNLGTPMVWVYADDEPGDRVYYLFTEEFVAIDKNSDYIRGICGPIFERMLESFEVVK